jgi:hypothetical protein
MMRNKTLIALTTALAFAAAASISTPADARGGRIAAGIIGGLAAGAIVGGALSRPYYYDYSYPAYYYGPGAYYGAGCYWRRVWTPYGWRPTRVCY